jgi:hypothetical protein
MENNFLNHSVLYYPTIEFQDETWVKAALTVWDKIYRIVPANYNPKDSDEVKKAIEADLIENINLSVEDLEEAADKFTSFCHKLRFPPAGFDSSTYDVRLHSDKIDSRLIPYFKGIASEFDSSGFFRLPESIANGYMFYLSKSVSSRRNIAKLTDNPDMFSGMIYFDGNGHFDESLIDDSINEMYCSLIIENLIPADIRSIKIDTIIDINKDMSVARNDFRKSVSEFTERIRKIKDKEFVVREIERFKKELLATNYTKKEIYKTFCDKLATSSLYVGFPTLVTSFYTSPSDLSDIIKLFDGVFIAGIASLCDAGKETINTWKSRRSNYYLELGKILDSHEKSEIQIRGINRLFNEFLND